MLRINYWAVVVAGVAAFMVSSVWYIIFGKELARVSAAFAEAQKQPEAWKMLAVLLESLVIAYVLAYVIGRIGNVDWMGAVGISALLWVGLSAMQWTSSIIWEKAPWEMAAIHAGDWLMKLSLIAATVGVWRR
jgi:hypothetical protein